MKLLLHACCGPCSLEPVRLLQEAGYAITICFANPNIQPREEYDKRLNVLRSWADEAGIPVVDLPYDLDAWRKTAGAVEDAGGPREERCRACYALRLEQSAAWGAAQGFEALSTTLAVSPYQLSEVCREELEAAAARHGLACVWKDFRPYYPTATTRSRELGMYRQNYCGCLYSKAEAEAERAAAKAAKAEERAAREAVQEAARAERASKQAAYDEKQRKKKEARNAARRAAHDAASDTAHQALEDEGWQG
ncbi:MAG: epoxyqueuosine reductase QueH [Eggerthellaceae bacterium]|nr:epoxyqueuosine reductase QueH [Eggerthellaceae bacterium]